MAKFRIRGSLWDTWFWILPFYAMRLRYFRTVLEITPRCYFNEVTRNHIALLFHRSYSKITSRCYFIEVFEITSRCYFKEVTWKSHRIAISPKLLEITSRCYFIEVRLLLVLNFDRIKIFEFSVLFPAISRLFKCKCSRELFNFNSATF